MSESLYPTLCFMFCPFPLGMPVLSKWDTDFQWDHNESKTVAHIKHILIKFMVIKYKKSTLWKVKQSFLNCFKAEQDPRLPHNKGK